MGFPDRSRTRLEMEKLEDRTVPATLIDAFTPALEATGSFVPDRVNVVMTTATNTTADAARLASAPFATEVTALGFGIYSISLVSGTDTTAAITYYSSLPGVLSAAPDEIVQLQLTPNDTNFSALYGMQRIGAETAWDTTTGNSNFIVAVIDTGVDYNHPDLVGNIWTNAGEIAGNGIDDDGNGYVDDIRGWDFINNDNNPMDDNNHGTHVAGTIGAVGNNSRGVVGVNWSVKIMSLKFLGASGSGSLSGAIAALNYAVTNGAKVSNNSWGGGGFNSSLAAAIGRARDAGHIFVAAAGNSGLNIDSSPSYPASYITSYDNVVAVAASNSSDTLASFSNYGASTVTLAAPGVSILSTTRNNTYSYFSGTSMATPHVAGAIALYWGANSSMTYSQVIDKLKTSVDVLDSLSGLVSTGGRLNVARMLESTSPPPPAAPGPKVVAATYSGTTSTQLDNVRITFDRDIDAFSFTSDDIVSFTGPGGAITTGFTITPVGGSSTQFDITFDAQTVAGSYSLILGPDILDTSGNQMNQDGDGAAGENPDDRYTATGSLVLSVNRTYAATGLPRAIRDFTTTNSYLTISDNITITDLNVQVSLTHTWVGDLRFDLIGPTGTTVRLFTHRGGSGDNLTNTIFNDEAGTHISLGAAPFTGNFRPEQSLSAFDGKSTQGSWRLRIYDAGSGDIGNLTAWSLIVTGNVGGGGMSVQTLGFLDEPTATGDAKGFDTPVAVEPSGNAEMWDLLMPASGGGRVMTWSPPEDGNRDPASPPEASEVRDDDTLPTFGQDSPAPVGAAALAPLYFAPEDKQDADVLDAIEME